MKTFTYSLLAIAIIALAACQKAPQQSPVYDNSNSYVSWTINPASTSPEGEVITSPPFIKGWCFTEQYKAQRMQPTANVSPFYGYPIGALTPDGKLSFNYSTGIAYGQSMSVFLNSNLKITGAGIYNVSPCFDNGYVARIGMNGSSKNLYLAGEKQSFEIESYQPGYIMKDRTPVTVVKGRFQISVSDGSSTIYNYTIAGTFQLPITY